MNLGNIKLEDKFEKAVRLISSAFPIEENRRKPILMHVLRVGFYLYENDYSEEIVLGGLLHDVLEFSDVTREDIEREFGGGVLEIVVANTQNREIEGKIERWEDMVIRCVDAGSDSLVVKAADVLDSLKFYKATGNALEIERSVAIGKFLLDKKPEDSNDDIFDNLRNEM